MKVLWINLLDLGLFLEEMKSEVYFWTILFTERNVKPETHT